MAQSLALEIYFLVEKLMAEKSPLVDALQPHWRNEYFEDLVATWKRMDRHTAELAEVKRSVQQLSALMLPFQTVEPQPVAVWSSGSGSVSVPEVVSATAAPAPQNQTPLDVCPHGYVAAQPDHCPYQQQQQMPSPVSFQPAPAKNAKRSRAKNPKSASSAAAARKRASTKVGSSMPELDF